MSSPAASSGLPLPGMPRRSRIEAVRELPASENWTVRFASPQLADQSSAGQSFPDHNPAGPKLQRTRLLQAALNGTAADRVDEASSSPVQERPGRVRRAPEPARTTSQDPPRDPEKPRSPRPGATRPTGQSRRSDTARKPGSSGRPNSSPSPKPPRQPAGRNQPGRRRRALTALKVTAATLVVLLAAQFISVVSFAWFTPPRTSYMLQSGEPLVYQYVSIDHMSRYVLAATIAHEDQQLGTRPGAFTWDELSSRADAWSKGEKDPSGSTIPQQLAKNIYLWPSQDPFRKTLEAGLSTEMAYLLPKKRILELYLNYAQFAPKLYGICAASWYYFNTPPWAMTEYQSAQLMGVLPLPERVKRAPGGGIDLGADADPLAWDLINGAANVWVPRQIEGMGGWQATVATVGITDTAADHVDTQNGTDGCSTMPDSVSRRLAAEGAR